MTPTQKLTYLMTAGIVLCTILFTFILYKYIEKQFENIDEVRYDFFPLPDSSFAFRKQYSLECIRTDNIPEFGEAHHIKVNRQNDVI